MSARWILLPLCLGAGVWLTQCAGVSIWDDGRKKKKGESDTVLKQRLSPEWLRKAEVVRTADQTIYYQGEAQAAPQTPLKGWAGSIKGEILMLTPRSALTCEEMTVTPIGTIQVKSRSTTYVRPTSSNEWGHLVAP